MLGPSPFSQRFAVAMWDFSWLTRRFGREAEYADFSRVLDEACERGYDCLRIDAFPHFIAALEDEPTRKDEFVVLPQVYAKQWGNSRPIATDLRRPLVQFIEQCRQRKIRVGLSTWFVPDEDELRCRLRTPADYVHAWRVTLRFLQREGLLDAVAWVDLCNEFPFVAWAYGAYPDIFHTGPWNSAAYFLPWSKRTITGVQSFIDNTIPVLKREFDLLFTFSMMCLPRKEHLVDVSHLDLLEPHLWLSDTLLFGTTSLGLLSTAQAPFAIPAHAAIARLLQPAFRPFWNSHLDRYLERISSWARAANKPLVTTEGWATTNFGGVRLSLEAERWGWLKDICHDAVHMAIAKGWSGVCTSNFCQPHFPAMWGDVAWHRSLTTHIRKDEM